MFDQSGKQNDRPPLKHSHRQSGFAPKCRKPAPRLFLSQKRLPSESVQRNCRFRDAFLVAAERQTNKNVVREEVLKHGKKGVSP
jgi:hypothetical protein